MNEYAQSNPGPLSPEELRLLDAMPDPALVLDSISRLIVNANQAFARNTGLDSQRIVGKRLEDIISVEDPAWRAALAKLDLEGGSASVEGRLPQANGPAISVRLDLPAFENGGRTFYLARARSLEPSDAEAAREREAEGLRELLDNANDAVYSHDLQGRMTYANRTALRIFGIPEAELSSITVIDLVDPAYHGLAQENIRMKVLTGESTPPYELLCRARDGSPIWLEVNTRLILSGGKPVGIQGIGRDITERKRSDNALRESEEKLERQQQILASMIEQNPYAIAFWTPEGACSSVNPAFLKLFGGRPPAEYNLLTDPQVRAAGLTDLVQRAIHNGETVFLERVIYKIANPAKPDAPERTICFAITLFPIRGADGWLLHLASIYQDLSSEIAAETAKAKLEAQLLQAQKMEAIGTLAGGVAHDFNNLLTGMLGYLDLIRTVTDKKIHGYIDKAEGAARRGCDLTRQLLAYARKSPIEPVAHDLNKTVAEVSALLRQTVDRRIALNQKPQSAPATIHADPGQMSQVLMNLCINARDALTDRLEMLSDAEKESWRPRIDVETRSIQITPEYCKTHTYARQGRFVCMSVSDNGIGMNEATKARIFDPFFTTKPQGKGTGLGLATLFGIVKQHEGWIDVYSEVGKGTVFNVYLPSIDKEPVPLSTEGMRFNAKGGAETILLVDDEEMIRELGKDILEGKGYKILLAEDGLAALDLFMRRKAEIDLVVLDLTMPGLTGAELLPKLKSIRPETPVIISSGYSSEDSMGNFLFDGAAAFVRKPYSSIDLARMVRQVLDEQKSKRS